MLVNIVGRMSHFVQLLDCMQLVAVTLYLEIQYPPILEQFLRGLAPVLFTFMKDAVNIVPYKFSSSKFIYYHVDSTLVRTQLASLIVFALLLGIAISVIAANTYKENWCKKLIPIVKYRGLNDIFCVLLTPLLLFGFHFAHGTKGDIFVSSCVAIAGIGYVTWISYKIGRIKRL